MKLSTERKVRKASSETQDVFMSIKRYRKAINRNVFFEKPRGVSFLVFKMDIIVFLAWINRKINYLLTAPESHKGF
jgi:hypothetical protein